MARQLKNKNMVNSRLANSYGGWMYCDACGENIGYLCYVTYDRLDFRYQCNCGSKGEFSLDFEDSKSGVDSDNALVTIKNRLCCPKEESPLITILDQKLKSYDLSISCKECGNIYHQAKN